MDTVKESGLPPELDFFGEKRRKENMSNAVQAVDDGQDKSKARIFGAQSNFPASNELFPAEDEMDEEKRKQLLRAHKIKITLLSQSLQPESTQVSEDKSKESGKTKKKECPKKETAAKQPLLYPRPLTSFNELKSRYNIGPRLARNVEDQGYREPTEVQLAALPLLMGDDVIPQDDQGAQPAFSSNSRSIDLLSVAPTGSGKTLAFLIPIMDALNQRRRDSKKVNSKSQVSPEEHTGPFAIVIAPTKELAGQIVNEGRKLALRTGMHISLLKKGMALVETNVQNDKVEWKNDGDTSVSGKSDEESDGSDEVKPSKRKRAKRSVVKSDVIVSTPLTLLHAIQDSKKNTIPLTRPQYFVLDEADVLLDPLFRDQTLAIWNACTNPTLRSTLWSATMPSSIESLALETLWNRPTPAPVVRLVVGLKDSAVPNIKHQLTYAATEAGKLLALRQLLHPNDSAATDSQGRKALRPPFLVFTQTIPRAVALHAELKFDIPAEAGGSSRIAVLHSGLSEGARSKVMAGFRRGEIWVIITTDLLARGVDFRGLNGVVNYDVPTSAAAYVHRVGRTGRAGREGGVAVTLYTKEDVSHVKGIANVIVASEKFRAKNGEVPESGVQEWFVRTLPTPSKREKKELKRRGVESRRAGARNAEQISTKPKSKFERKIDARKSVAKRERLQRRQLAGQRTEDTDFEGFDD
jgi:ATP-dependent RNA helicase DDX52/ROK1